ncbi:MAG: ribonuclease J [Firmicutes bacterium]|nr:ribonuclease J [Bacillota bacterium]
MKKNQNEVLRIVPLGGLQEIGKNITVFEYGDDIVILDCGMAFPDSDMLGVDIVIPDFTYLRERAEKIRGLIVTHAHEDHIGAIPYLLQEFDVPVYASRLTLGFIEYKLKEHGIKGDLKEIAAGDFIRLGSFTIETLHTTHSVADSLAFCIDTPAGTVFHTGDFKIDLTPIDGQMLDFSRLSQIGDGGVSLLMADSTNAGRRGHSLSESSVGLALESILKTAKGRVIIASFSSNVHRVQKIMDLAAANGRKIAVCGRSMENMIRIASELGYMTIPAGSLIDIKDLRLYDDEDLLIITTGSQGETMSALARMAAGEHKQVRIRATDTVILSSSPVPGNEKTVSNIVNELMEKGAKVIYNEIADVHASGHGNQEELKLMQALLKPEYFMPVHGEQRHLQYHAELARQMGIPQDNIIIGKNGMVVELFEGKARLSAETVTCGAIMVDGLGIGDVGSVVLNERKNLSVAGLVVATVVYDTSIREIIAGPELHTRGFIYVQEYGTILQNATGLVREALMDATDDQMKDIEAIRKIIRDVLRNYFYDRLNRSPVILPIVIEI